MGSPGRNCRRNVPSSGRADGAPPAQGLSSGFGRLSDSAWEQLSAYQRRSKGKNDFRAWRRRENAQAQMKMEMQMISAQLVPGLLGWIWVIFPYFCSCSIELTKILDLGSCITLCYAIYNSFCANLHVFSVFWILLPFGIIYPYFCLHNLKNISNCNNIK